VFLLWFAPAIVVRSPLRDFLIAHSLDDFPGRIVLGSASAGWFSPVAAQDVSVLDGSGGEVAKVPVLRTEKSLLSLIADTSQLGTIRVERPLLLVKLREGGSNVEDLIRPLLARDTKGRPVACTVEIVDGTISVQSALATPAAEPACTISHVNATFTLPGDTLSMIGARLKGEVAAAAQPAARFAAEAQLQPANPAQGGAGLNGSVNLETAGFPLEVLTPIAQRFAVNLRVQGQLSIDASVTLSEQTATARIEQLQAQNLVVAAPEFLGADQIQLASLAGRGEISRSGGRWQASGLELSSDMFQLNASGSAPAGTGPPTKEELVTAFQSATGELSGRVDVARLAAMLPTTLRIREATHVSSGEVAVVLSSQQQADGKQWSARLEATNLAALHQGRPIKWREPVLAQVLIRNSAGAWSIDRLACESSFLKLSGQGTLEQGQFTAHGDLASFAGEIGQFVDVGGLRAAGKVQSQVNWHRDTNQLLALHGSVVADQLQVASESLLPWHEARLDVQFSAAAKTSGHAITGLDQARIDVRSAGDRLAVELREPVPRFSSDASWPVRCSVQGDLGQWLTRLQMFFQPSGWQIDGEELDVAADAILSSRRIVLSEAKAKVDNFKAYGAAVYVREPELQLQTSGVHDLSTGEWTATQTTLVGTAVAVRADHIQLRPQGQNRFVLDGDVQYRTDLERLAAWLREPRQPAAWWLTGAVTGALRFASAAGITHADLTADVSDFSYSKPHHETVASSSTGSAGNWKEVWQEPRLQIAVQGSYDANADFVQLERVEAAGESLSLGAAGEVQHPFTRGDVQLAGEYAYDLQKITQRLRGSWGTEVSMTGTGRQSFTLRGPLLAVLQSDALASASPAASVSDSLRDLAGNAGIAWNSLAIAGFNMGPAEIEGQLEQGLLTVAPLEIPLGSGTDGVVRLSPRMDLNRTPRVVTVSPGTVIDQVRISPEMCRLWLKYVTPWVADATAAEGQFSVQLENAEIPANAPAQGRVAGKLIVHSARVGPGPLSQDILQLVQQVRSLLDPRLPAGDAGGAGQWLELPAQQVNLELADGKIFHRDLQMTIRDVVVRTQGWVGLDQQLALIAEIPIRDEWVAQDRYLSTLRGQTVKLPIYGSLSRRQVDTRAMAAAAAELSRQSIRDAGTNFLQEQLNRGLERLLPTRPPAQPQAPPQP
jgi:hypothetical protein